MNLPLFGTNCLRVVVRLFCTTTLALLSIKVFDPLTVATWPLLRKLDPSFWHQSLEELKIIQPPLSLIETSIKTIDLVDIDPLLMQKL